MSDNKNEKSNEALASGVRIPPGVPAGVTGGKSVIIQPSPASRLKRTPASTGTNLSEAAMWPGRGKEYERQRVQEEQ